MHNLFGEIMHVKKIFLIIVVFFFSFLIVIPADCAAVSNKNYSTLGSGVGYVKKSGVRVSAGRVNSNISVIEYDTYGKETGYYIQDAFGMTNKYDKNGNLLSKYKTNQVGLNYIYDKYGHVAGYMVPVSSTRTEFYDKYGNAIGYFEPDANGLIKKYDMQGIHLNTYKRP